MITKLEKTIHFILEHRSDWTSELEFYLYGSTLEIFSPREERTIATTTIDTDYLVDLCSICDTLGIRLY